MKKLHTRLLSWWRTQRFILNPAWFIPVVVLALAAGQGHAAQPDVVVPVLTQAVPAGQVLTAQQVAMQRVSATQVYAGTVRSMAQAVGLRTTRAMRAGQALNSLTLKAVPTITRQQMVEVLYHAPGIQLTASGQALQDGAMGQTIRVLNTASRATVLGQVTGPGQVTLSQ